MNNANYQNTSNTCPAFVCVSFYFSLDFLFHSSGEEDDGTEGGVEDGGAAWRGAGSSTGSRPGQSQSWALLALGGGSLMAALGWAVGGQLVSPLQAMTKAGGGSSGRSLPTNRRRTIRRTKPGEMRVRVLQLDGSCRLRVSKCSWQGCSTGSSINRRGVGQLT